MNINFQQVMGSTSYRSWSKWTPGDYLAGKFVSTKVDNYGKNNYTVEVYDASFSEGETPKKGSMFTFNSNGALDHAMENDIEKGDIIKVIYKGKDTMTKGKYAGKQFHSLEILKAPSQAAPSTSSDEDVL